MCDLWVVVVFLHVVVNVLLILQIYSDRVYIYIQEELLRFCGVYMYSLFSYLLPVSIPHSACMYPDRTQLSLLRLAALKLYEHSNTI